MFQKLSYTHHVGKSALIHHLCWHLYSYCLFQSTNIIGIRQTSCVSSTVLTVCVCVFSIAADWSIIYSQFDSIVHQLRIIPQSYLRISHHLLSIHDRFGLIVFICWKSDMSKYISFIISSLWNPKRSLQWCGSLGPFSLREVDTFITVHLI